MRDGYRAEFSPPRPPRATARDLRFIADIHRGESPRGWRWRAYVFEGADLRNPVALAEANGGEESEEAAVEAARTWLFNQARLIYGGHY